jgi:hypothetical protein
LQERYEDDHSTYPKLDWICGWRLDCLMDLVKIRFMVFQTLQPRICGRVVVYRSLVPHNQVQALNFWLSRRLYKNKLKLRRFGLVLRQTNLDPRGLNLGDCMRSCSQASVVHVVYLVAHLVLTKIQLCLLLYLLSSR